MRFRVSITATLAALLVICMFTPAQAQLWPDNKLEKQFLADIDKLMPGMGAEKIVDRKDAQMAFEKICMENSAPGKDKERAALCKAIMQRVGPTVAAPARVWLLRKVESIGRDEVVAPLSKLLHAECPCTRELARRVLENNPSSKAGAALRDELKVAKDPAWRAAIINALTFRHDGDAVKAIAADLNNADPVVAKAALAALGEIGTAPAIKALNAELAKLKTVERGDLVVDACLRGAGRAAALGDRNAAIEIYKIVLRLPVKAQAPDTGETIPMAALAGLATVGGADALPELLKAIVAKEAAYEPGKARVQLAAASYVQRIPGQKVTQQLTDAMAKATPNTQVVLLDTLGKRGDVAAAATVNKSLKAPEAEVRAAAISALSYIGNGGSVEVLVNFAATATGPERDAARESLKWMRGSNVDEAITKLIVSAQDRTKAELVRAAAVRLMKPQMDELLAYVNDSDESVRTPVIYNLGKLAELKDLPKILKALAINSEQSAGAVNEAVLRICSRAGDADKQAAALIAVMKTVDPAAQIVAVKTLANIKGDTALAGLHDAANSDNALVKEVAVKALATRGPKGPKGPK